MAMPLLNNGVFVLLMIMTSCVALEVEENENYPSIDAIYQFGDSISDVGNLIREPVGDHASTVDRVTHLPYGETYFHKPTGRFSNGLLMVDFLAKELNLPFLNPYLEKEASFAHGVNFAVAGATALDYSFFAQRKIVLSLTNSSLSVQLDWFKTHLASLCQTSSDCTKKLENALFLVGEIGGNDLNYAFTQGKTIEEVQTYVPHIVQTITDAVQKLIQLGATKLVVPGNFAFGCMPIYLTSFQRNGENLTSKNQCLEIFNKFARFYNDRLQSALQVTLYKLREQHPDVVVVYADLYNTHLSLFKHAKILGYEEGSLLKACCGIGGDYNFDSNRMCGSKGASACAHPERYVSWDGIHLTQQAYGDIALALIPNLFSKLKCT